ncbi:MAG TPA: hypothetical protein PK781_03100 [Terrimesophilobacter sp.]|nr:hypothetical protein [Terrimesophilobacter sp.]HRP99433.1 hypothetical protein [Terrimesophilobacter sp.]
MGYLLYGQPPEEIEVDDRALAHIKLVMIAKLRRNESFAFSFAHNLDGEDGRSTVWVHPAIALRFRFSESQQPPINRAWLDQLVAAANSVDGLRLLPEP